MLAPERGMSPFQRIALVGALFAGLVGGLFLTNALLGDATAAAVSPAVAATLDPASPAVATMTETSPPEPIAGAEDAVAPELDADAAGDEAVVGGGAVTPAREAPAPAAAPVVQSKPERPHPARSQNRPRPRREIDPAPAETQPEDLYDTR